MKVEFTELWRGVKNKNCGFSLDLSQLAVWLRFEFFWIYIPHFPFSLEKWTREKFHKEKNILWLFCHANLMDRRYIYIYISSSFQDSDTLIFKSPSSKCLKSYHLPQRRWTWVNLLQYSLFYNLLIGLLPYLGLNISFASYNWL